MTIKELSQFYWLNKEIAHYEEPLEVLYAKASNTTPVLTGMPHAPGVSDKVGKCAAEIADQREKLETARARCIEERDRLMAYIELIPDSLTRQIFMLRFADCLSWDEVAESIGGGNTGGSVKQRVFRYINS